MSTFIVSVDIRVKYYSVLYFGWTAFEKKIPFDIILPFKTPLSHTSHPDHLDLRAYVLRCFNNMDVYLHWH